MKKQYILGLVVATALTFVVLAYYIRSNESPAPTSVRVEPVEEGVIYYVTPGEVRVTFSADATMHDVENLLRERKISAREPLTVQMQFREIQNESQRLQDLFTYLQERNMVSDCRVTDGGNAVCDFKNNITYNEAVSVAYLHPNTRLYTEAGDETIVMWDLQNSWLSNVRLVVPEGEEHHQASQLLQHPLVSTATATATAPWMPGPH